MKKKNPRVSIVIPCKRIDARTKDCIGQCMKVDYPDYEVLVLPDCDEGKEILDKRIRVIQTGPIKPMSKRFMASSISRGDICAFIDADAFPDKNWLRNAVRHFSDSDVAAVAGPSLTPSDDDVMAKASGLVLASPFGGGPEAIRYASHSQAKYVTEAPTCNLVIRKSVLRDVKELVPNIWPGEEIVLCGAISKYFKKKILHDPQVIVYHHRRPLYLPHLKQIWSYGAIKGHLLKSWRKFIRPHFLIPSLLVIGFFAGFLLAIAFPAIRPIYALLVLAYIIFSAFGGILVGLQERSAKLSVLVFTGIVATHITYGLAFLRGLFPLKGLE